MTAAQLLLRQSFGSVSVDDICKAADVKKGTFYHHFPSKVELTLAAYDYMWAEGKKKLDPCFSPSLTAIERFENYAKGAYSCHKQLFDTEGKIYGCPIACAGHEMAAQDERIREKINSFFDGHCTYIESAIRDLPQHAQLTAEERGNLAHEVFSYAMGVLYQAKVANDPEVIRRDLLPGLKRLLRID